MFSISVFISITLFVISKQFAFDPIVFTSLFISCTRKSNFLPVLVEISKGSSNWTPQMVNNVNTLVSLIQAGKVDISKQKWKSPLTLFLHPASTYDRPSKDFIYTATIADIMSDPAKQRHYFKDLPKDVVDEFFDASNNVKPAGSSSDPYNTDTIYGTVEKLSGENHQNVKKDDKRLKDNR